MKLLKKNTVLDEDMYVISESERLELMDYRRSFNHFLRLYTNYTKNYKHPKNYGRENK